MVIVIILSVINLSVIMLCLVVPKGPISALKKTESNYIVQLWQLVSIKSEVDQWVVNTKEPFTRPI